MAVSPEIRSFIDILHEDVRDEAWMERLENAYTAFAETIPASDLVSKPQIIQEVLRQHVDEDILGDVFRAAQADSAEGFVHSLTEPVEGADGESYTPVSSWKTGQVPIPEDEEAELRNVLGNPEDTSEFERQLQTAAKGADFDTMVMLLMQLNNPEPDSPPIQRDADGEITGHASPQGEALFDYIKDAMYEANSNHGFSDFTPPGGGPEDAGRLNVLTPDEMVAMFEVKILNDIKNGTFPVGSFSEEEALEVTERIVGILQENVLNDRATELTRGITPAGRITYHMKNDDNQIKAAIDQMFSGEDPVLDNDMSSGWNAAQYGKQFYDVNMTHAAAMDFNDVRTHFVKLIDGYDTEPVSGPSEFVPPQLDIPPEMREQFLADLSEAYDHATAGGLSNYDPEAFGEFMADKYGMIDRTYTQTPMNTAALDYGERMEVFIGEPTENGFNVVDHDGNTLFEMNGNDIALYQASGEGESFAFDDIRGVENAEELKTLLGDSFYIRPISPLDAGLENSDSNPLGYYIESPNTSNSFHVGFDAIAETSTSAEFRAARDASMDTRDEAPEVATPDLVVAYDDSRSPPPLPLDGGPG